MSIKTLLASIISLRSALLLSLFFIWSCSSDDDPDIEEPSVLVSSDSRETRLAVQIAPFVQVAGIDVASDDLKYDVELINMTYTTTVRGQEVVASALVMLPVTDNEVGILSFHRGTITRRDEAPSELPETDLQLTLFSGVASIGLAAVFPDMIGFGTTLEMVHPYYVGDINANTVRDAIVATQELLSQREMSASGDLFLAGYSQGGYITMAAQESIERSPIRGLDLVATFPAAGAYDVKGLQEYFFTLDTYEQPYYLAYVGVAYEEYYELDVDFTDIFNDPYAPRIPGLFDGTLSNSEINDQLSFEIDELLKPEFLNGLDTDDQYASFNQLLIDNGLIDWTPSVPTFLYHGDADTFIPVENSIDTFDQLIENGASENDLSLTIIPGADHGGGVLPYASDVLERLVDFLE